MVAMNLSQRLARGELQQIHQVGIILLLEVMQRLAYQPVGIQLTPQRAKFASPSRAQQRIGHALRAAKTGDDAADCGYFHLRRSVANQKNSAVADSTLHRNPS